MSTPIAKSRMDKIMQLIPLSKENTTRSLNLEKFQKETATLPMDVGCDLDLEMILHNKISPSLLNIAANSLAHFEQSNTTVAPSKALVEYSDTDSDNSYILMDLDGHNLTIDKEKFDNNNFTTFKPHPSFPTLVKSPLLFLNEDEPQPSTSSQPFLLEPNPSMTSEDVSYVDSEDSWHPPLSSNDEEKELTQLEEETCIGKRGYRKVRPLPKRLLKKKNLQSRKSVQPNPCVNKKCGNSCAAKFSEDDRIVIFENYWGLGNDKRQKDFLLSCAKVKPIGRKRAISNIRKVSYDYFINFNGQNIKICQQFLLKTLNISQMTLRYTIENANKILNTTQKDKRTPRPHNKSDAQSVTHLKSFIEMLPAVPSHYCRNKSSKLYLPQEFQNIPTLYKMYVDHLKENDLGAAILSIKVFRTIFKKEFKKHKNMSPESRVEFEQTKEYKNHIQDKNKCKQLLLEDQNNSKAPGSTSLCVSFDLQKVLNTPHGKSVTLYYSRKYAFYNESIYETGTRVGYCYVWGECQGKRGCNEIVTVLFKYLTTLDSNGTHRSINLYADSCAGQNRNRAMLSMLIHFIKTARTIEEIKMTYLLPGHTMMPVDSIHSTIESFIRTKTVWAPSEWPTMITNARTNPTGYEVIVLNHEDFMDWKSFSQALLPAKIKISFNSLRVVYFQKNNPIVKLQYGFIEDCEKNEINMNLIIRSRANSSVINKGPSQLYHDILKISASKYKDLVNLCNKNVIPSRYHVEYLNMKHDGTIPDELAETDVEDSDSI